MEERQHSSPAEPPGRPQGGEEIADFVVSMIQAFLRTGYYLPEHPEAQRAKEGLYDKFCRLSRLSREVTFLLRSGEGGQVVLIEGLAPHPLELRDIMVGGMADTYNPRFVTYLERKQLISLSVSAQMGPEEFYSFIDLMSEPALADMQESSLREKFTRAVKARGISHLSFVFSEDFITAGRQLPWRASLALSRMKKDLYLIPIYRNLTPEQMGNVRHEVLSDILRPLNVPDLVYAFLMNIDLAATAELSPEEAEDLIFSLVEEDSLLSLAALFTGDASGREKKYRDVLPEEKFRRVLGKLTVRLQALLTRESRAELEEMFNAGLITVEQLPAEVRDTVREGQLVNAFVENGEKYLAYLDRIREQAAYHREAGKLVGIVPALLQKGHSVEAVSILEKLYSHLPEDLPRAAAARELMADLVTNGSLDEATRVFLTAPKEERITVARFFQLLGQWSLPHLLRIIRESDDVWRRKQATELLSKAGPAGAGALLKEMRGGRLPEDTLGTVIRVLGEGNVKKLHPEITGEALSLCGNPNPEVRREALAALGRLDPSGRFEAFAGALGDKDPRVRKQAIRCLGGTGDSRSLEPLMKVILEAERSGEDRDWDMAAAAMESCGRLSEAAPTMKEKVSALLCEVAERGYPKSALRRMVGRSQLPSPVLAALAEALSRVGDDRARKMLERLAGEKDPTASRRAAEALRKMGSAPEP